MLNKNNPGNESFTITLTDRPHNRGGIWTDIDACKICLITKTISYSTRLQKTGYSIPG